MYVVTVTFVAKPEFSSQFRKRVVKQAADSLEHEAACRTFDVCTDPEDQTRIFLYEVYDDADAFKAHLDTPHYKAFDRDRADWIVSKSVAIFNKLA